MLTLIVAIVIAGLIVKYFGTLARLVAALTVVGLGVALILGILDDVSKRFALKQAADPGVPTEVIATEVRQWVADARPVVARARWCRQQQRPDEPACLYVPAEQAALRQRLERIRQRGPEADALLKAHGVEL